MVDDTKTTPVPAEALVTFVPDVSFTGFPNDIRTKFTAGVESAPIPADYLDLLREKGLVREPDQPNEGKTVADEVEQHIDEPAAPAAGETVKPQGKSGEGEGWGLGPVP
jgi:hypothetical protein